MKSKTICYDDIFEFCEDVDSSFLRKYYAAIKDNSTFNGAYGDVADGKFTVGAKKGKVIMQIERGDDEYMPTYKIVKGEHVRVLDLAKLALNMYLKAQDLQKQVLIKLFLTLDVLVNQL